MSDNYCPLCGEKNECMIKNGELFSCWCGKEEFPKEIFEFIPAESRGKSCICKKCLIKYKEEERIRKTINERQS